MTQRDSIKLEVLMSRLCSLPKLTTVLDFLNFKFCSFLILSLRFRSVKTPLTNFCFNVFCEINKVVVDFYLLLKDFLLLITLIELYTSSIQKLIII